MQSTNRGFTLQRVSVYLQPPTSADVVQVSQARKAAEIGKEDWEAVAQAPPWAVDAWGLGCLMQEAYSGQPLQKTESLRNLDDIPKSVAQVGQYSRCTELMFPPSRHTSMAGRCTRFIVWWKMMRKKG